MAIKIKGAYFDEDNNLVIPNDSLNDLIIEVFKNKPKISNLRNFLGRFNYHPAHIKFKLSKKIKFLNDKDLQNQYITTPLFDEYGMLNSLDTTNKKYYYLILEKFKDGRLENFKIDHFPLFFFRDYVKDDEIVSDYNNFYYMNNGVLTKLVDPSDVTNEKFNDSLYEKLETIDEFIYIYDESHIDTFKQPEVGEVYFNIETEKFYIFSERKYKIEYREVEITDNVLSVPKQYEIVEDEQVEIDSEKHIEITEYYWEEYLNPEDYIVLEEHFVRKWIL